MNTYYLLSSPSSLSALLAELTHAMPSLQECYTWTTRESLPYLSAVILEDLRLSFEVPTRLARISPHRPIRLQSEWQGKPIDVKLPPGVPIGMFAGLVHVDERLFPDPHTFKPERWLRADGTRDRSKEKYIVSFSKGSRQCLGIK